MYVSVQLYILRSNTGEWRDGIASTHNIPLSGVQAMVVVCRQRLLHHMTVTHSHTHAHKGVFIVSSHNSMGTAEFLIHDTLKCGHLDKQDTFGCSKTPVCIHYNPWNQDTPLIWTFSSVPSVSIIEKFHCNAAIASHIKVLEKCTELGWMPELGVCMEVVIPLMNISKKCFFIHTPV